MRTFGLSLAALLFTTIVSGCSTGPVLFMDDSCQSGPEPGSDQWWAEQALLPPGVRQKCHKGKMWPVRPRPTVPPQQFSHTYHSSHYWPLPYICQDRQWLNDTMNVQTRNGWQQFTTLFDRHFDNTQQLTVSGRNTLDNILVVTPPEHRIVYIQAVGSPEIENARVAAVQAVTAELTGRTEEVSVVVQRTREYTRPAQEVWNINDLYNSSTPSPRLGGAGGGGGGGGGLGGGAAPGGP